MKIVDQSWGAEDYKIACRHYAESCIEENEMGQYWELYRNVLDEGAENVFNRIFRDRTELPQEVRDALLKVCRFMEFSQNIPILNHTTLFN